MLANVVEAKEPPCPGAVEIRRLERRFELAWLITAGNGAPRLRSFHPPMQS